MAEEVFVKVEGVDELIRVLKAMPEKIRKKAVADQLKKAANLIRDDAKQRAPVLQGQIPKNRTRGLVKRKISTRPSKYARKDGDVGYFVGVRPAPGAKFKTKKALGFKYKIQKRASQRGANSPLDPFYWRFLEFGTAKMPARPFLQSAAKAKGSDAIRMFIRESVAAINRLDRKGA